MRSTCLNQWSIVMELVPGSFVFWDLVIVNSY